MAVTQSSGIEDKAAFLWTHHYERALGCSHPNPCDYADQQVAAWRARQPKAPRPAYHGPRAGSSRAGMRQAAERRAIESCRR